MNGPAWVCLGGRHAEPGPIAGLGCYERLPDEIRSRARRAQGAGHGHRGVYQPPREKRRLSFRRQGMPCQRASSVSAYPAEHCERPQRNRPQVREAFRPALAAYSRPLSGSGRACVVGAGAGCGGAAMVCWMSSSSAWLSRSTAVRFGIGAIREEAQRSLMHPRRDKISCRPDLLITNDGAIEGRLLGTAAVVDPCGYTARWWFVLYPAPDFRVVKTLQEGL
jgi:hypothetical protein